MLIFLSWLSVLGFVGNRLAKECNVPVLVRYVIDGDYILQDFGGEDVSYLSREDFDKLRSGEEEASLEVGLKSWCIVKLE